MPESKILPPVGERATKWRGGGYRKNGVRSLTPLRLCRTPPMGENYSATPESKILPLWGSTPERGWGVFSPCGGEGHEVAWGVRKNGVRSLTPLRLCRTPPMGENCTATPESKILPLWGSTPERGVGGILPPVGEGTTKW
jgi:hypothetical protein